MAISIGDAILHLGVNTSDLDKDMKKLNDNIKSQVKTVGMAFAGFGVAITGAMAASIKAAAEEAEGTWLEVLNHRTEYFFE
jgi:hypothetical protein